MVNLVEEKLVCILLDFYNGKIPKKIFDPLSEILWDFLLKIIPEKYQSKSTYMLFRKDPSPQEIKEIISMGNIKREKINLKQLQKQLGTILLNKAQIQKTLKS